jgi:hypothetical protein
MSDKTYETFRPRIGVEVAVNVRELHRTDTANKDFVFRSSMGHPSTSSSWDRKWDRKSSFVPLLLWYVPFPLRCPAELPEDGNIRRSVVSVIGLLPFKHFYQLSHFDI